MTAADEKRLHSEKLTHDEKRVQSALENVHVPPSVARKTLEHIESLCAAEHAEQTGAATNPAPKVHCFRTRFIAALAACLALFALVIGGGFYFLTPAAYVAIDVNPSLELGVNRLGLVSDTQALNSDGEAILSRVDVRWMSYEDALIAIKSELTSYTSPDTVIELTVVCDEQDWSNQLADEGRHCFETGGGHVVCSHASSYERSEAHSAGMGIGKWRIYTQLVNAGVTLTPEEASQMTMHELYDLAEQENVPLSGTGSAGGAGTTSSADTTSSSSEEAAGAQESYGDADHSGSGQSSSGEHSGHHYAQNAHGQDSQNRSDHLS